MSSGDRTRLRGGIDVGGTKIEAAIVDASHSVLAHARTATPTEGGPPEVIAALAGVLTEAARNAGVDPAALVGVGVGSPGEVDAAAGTVANARNLPNWTDAVCVSDLLSDALGTPVSVGNDVQVATGAEARLGAGRGADSLLGVFWGTGVGGGLVLGGQPWLGRKAAGEIGHMVVRMGGARCTCGRRGCLEAYAGRAAMEAKARREARRGAHTDLFKIMQHHGKTRLTSGVWARALKHGDPLAQQLIRRAIDALGAGIASAVNLLDVELVVIGGGLGVRFGDSTARDIAQAMQPHLFNDDRPPAVQVAALGDLGGAIGAALLVESAPRALEPAAR